MKRLFCETTSSQKKFLIQALFAASFLALTSGVFLSGLAGLMGGGDMLISYISIAANICGIFVLLFASYLQKARKQKRLTILLTAASRVATMLIVLIPLLVRKEHQLYFFIPAVLCAFTLQGLALVALNNWLAFYTPTDKRGQYISLRQTISLIVSVVFSLLGGMYIDAKSAQYFAFVVLFAIAFVASITEVLTLFGIDDACIVIATQKKQKRMDALKAVLKNKEFMLYVFRVTLFYFFLYISDSFTIVFMLKYLGLPYMTITFLQMIISLPQIFFLGIWGKISDKRGHKFVLNLSIGIFAGETFFLFMTSPQNWMVFIPIAFFIASIGNAAFIVSLFNRRYEIIPEESRMFHDSFFTAIIGVAFILAPLVGELIRKAISSTEVISSAFVFADIRFMYLISTAGILLLQLVFHLVDKRKAKKLKIK